MGNILIIDDDPHIREILNDNITLLGHVPFAAETLGAGKTLLQSQAIDMVFLDIRLPDGNGLDSLPHFKNHSAAPEVVIITGVGDAASAEMAIRSGAWDYLQKPLSRHKIQLQIERVFDFRSKTGGPGRIVSLKRDGIIGAGPALNACLDLVAQCAATDTNVLITGETGTGKELFARAIHDNSHRYGEEFIVVDCASLPEHLVESILFGHEKGAFTGADRKKKGLLQAADGGTLFLDEVGELPLSLQKSFLRVLQERRFRAVGAAKETRLDFRLIAATNRNLDHMAAKSAFRLDLLFRLRTFEIHLPPLRSRPEDIHALTNHYIYDICKRHRLKVKGMLPEFVEHLEAYDWPGNVRELINTIQTAVLSDPENPMLFPMHLPPVIRTHFLQQTLAKSETDPLEPDDPAPPAEVSSPEITGDELVPFKTWRNTILEKQEKVYLQHLMAETEGDIQRACDIAKLSQSRLYYLLKKHDIPKSP